MTSKTVRMLMMLAGIAGMVYAQSACAQDATAPAKPCPAGEAPKEHGPRHGGNPAEMLTKALNLTADQQTQVKAIFDESKPAMKALMEDKTLSKEDKGAKMKELHTATNAKIRALLTADQQKAFDEFQQKHQRGPGPGGHHKAPPAAQ